MLLKSFVDLCPVKTMRTLGGGTGAHAAFRLNLS
jgi:hypothetical protein